MTRPHPRLLLQGAGPSYKATLLDAANQPVTAAAVRFARASGYVRAGDQLCTAAAGSLRTIMDGEEAAPVGESLTDTPDGELLTYFIK